MSSVQAAQTHDRTQTRRVAGGDETLHSTSRRLLLTCGIIGGILYPLADIFAAMRYPGFSYRDQAVSEMFAIGAPTSHLVVLLFTISSSLLLVFSAGIWMSANGSRLLRWASVMIALGMADALVLWNFFPMHMRGVTPTTTDLMHGLLAIDPFLLVALILAAIAFPGKFRRFTIATMIVTTALALTAFRYVPAVIANEPTPWMGISERAGQYLTNLWYAIFALVLLRHRANPSPS